LETEQESEQNFRRRNADLSSSRPLNLLREKGFEHHRHVLSSVSLRFGIVSYLSERRPLAIAQSSQAVG
jgi:hypothetical protein